MTTERISSRWARAATAVPRESFIPTVIYDLDRGRAGGDLVPIDRDREPRRWARLVAEDDAIVTQVDDGAPLPDGSGREATSSVSMPTVVVGMLDALDAQPGERVLEIGTGTGWNAALLASIVGSENVVTIEIDEQIAERAKRNLVSAGYAGVQVLAADAAALTIEGTFDRVIATVGVSAVPYGWVTALVDGGRLVAPLTGPYEPPGIVVLTRHDDTAAGSLAGPADFMALRSERVTRRSVVEFDAAGPHTQATTEVHPYYLTGDRPAAVAIGQRVRGIHRAWRPVGEDSGCLWLYAPAERSIGTLDIDNGLPYEVEQTGHRQLVDEVLAAHAWWRDRGEPSVEDWHVTVGPQGQRIALDLH